MKYQVGYKYRKNGFNCEVIYREGEMIISDCGSAGFEVMQVRYHGLIIKGWGVIPPGEYLPSNNEWGKLGWTYGQISDARVRLAVHSRLLFERRLANTTTIKKAL